MPETQTKTNRRLHVTFCYRMDADDVELERYIEIIERILPGGAMVTATEHKGGYCVAGDRDREGDNR